MILRHGKGGGLLLIFWGLKNKGLVERLCKKPAKITLRPPCCHLNFKSKSPCNEVYTTRDAIHPMTSQHSSPRQNK